MTTEKTRGGVVQSFKVKIASVPSFKVMGPEGPDQRRLVEERSGVVVPRTPALGNMEGAPPLAPPGPLALLGATR